MASSRLQPGAHLGQYELLAVLGEGGMGAVYRARDTKLNRDVALKVLLPEVADDPDRLARFRREAHVLASLNHPHIGAIHGLEESHVTIALVLELVEGPTLADRIARGPLPLAEALPIARQIAEALEAAHEQGIIHRDLKPANIKVRDDGTVKVLDFGLAKAMEKASGSGESGRPGGAAGVNRPDVPASPGPPVVPALTSPTLTSPVAVTRVGVIVGTAAYMSPEQARGKAVDRRTDLWAFGCVLYEMLTGQRAFAGEDVAVTLARVAEREPDWAALPAGVPPLIRRLLRRCLEKDRKRRLADASDARLEIEDALSAGERAETAIASSVPDTVPRRVMRMRVAAVGVVVALVVGGSVALGMWLATRPAPLRVGQFPIAASPGTAVAGTSADRAVAITPDGSRVVYVGNNARALFVRSLDTLEPLNLYTGAPRGPFTSPDNQWIGFIDNTSTLKKVAITGGPAATLLTLDGTSRGATWLPNDEIVFATGAPLTGLQQVAAGGGAVTVLTRPDREKGEADHVWPEALPGGRSLLFTIISTTGGTDAAQIAVLDLDTGQQTVVVRGGSHALYVDSGHLIYGAGGTLRAIAFDLATRTTRGAPVAVIPDVMEKVGQVGGGVEAAVAQDGTLAYVRGRGAAQRTLSWVDRQGRETPISAPPRPYLYPRLSPDGGRLAAWVNDQDNDLWLWDMVRVNLTHLTFSPGTDMYPVWALDGHRIVFSSDRDGGQRNLYGQAADGTGPVERLTTSPNLQSATGLTPDGTQLIFTEIARTRATT